MGIKGIDVSSINLSTEKESVEIKRKTPPFYAFFKKGTDTVEIFKLLSEDDWKSMNQDHEDINLGSKFIPAETTPLKISADVFKKQFEPIARQEMGNHGCYSRIPKPTLALKMTKHFQIASKSNKEESPIEFGSPNDHLVMNAKGGINIIKGDDYDSMFMHANKDPGKVIVNSLKLNQRQERDHSLVI